MTDSRRPVVPAAVNTPSKANATTGTGAAVSALSAASDAVRVYLFVQNLSQTSGENIHIDVTGVDADTDDLVIGPGAAMEWSSPGYVPQGAVSAISAAGTPKALILYVEV